jgi:hypothetical protein
MHQTTSSVHVLVLCLFLLSMILVGANANAAGRQTSAAGANPASAVSAKETVTPPQTELAPYVQRRFAKIKSFIRNSLGIWRFALALQIIFAGLALLPLGMAYRKRAAREPRLSFVHFTRRQLKRFSYLLCLLIVTDVFLLSNHLLARGEATVLWDADAAYGPYQILVSDFARSGKLLQWDPWTNGGMPAGSDPQVGANSPVNVLLGFLMGGSGRSFTFYWLLMWWLGGVGVLLLARHLKAPCWGGAVVALGFLFSGFYTGHAEHTSAVISLSAAPFVLWRLDAALLSRRLQPAIEAGAIWGLSALSGYPAQTILTGCFAALWALGRWLCSTQTAEERIDDSQTTTAGPALPLRKTMGALTAMLVVGCLVLLPTYFAFFYEGAGTHTRVGGVPREVAVTQNALTPSALATFTSPYLSVLKLHSIFQGTELWPGLDISMCSIYTGVVLSVLACFALAIRPRDRWRWWLVGIGFLSLICAMGDATPLRGWLYDWFYPTRFFRQTSLFRAYYLLSLTTLALIGTRDLARSLKSLSHDQNLVWRRFCLTSTIVSGAALLTFAIFLYSLPAIEILRVVAFSGYAHAIGVWLGMIVLSAVVWRLQPAARRIWLPALLIALAVGDAFATHTLSSSIMFSLGAGDRWRTLDQQHQPALDLMAMGLERIERSAYPPPWDKGLTNDQMITKIPAFEAYSPASNQYHLSLAGDPAAKGMAVGSRRIWFARQTAQLDLSDGALEAYRRRAAEIRGYPVIIHSANQMLHQKRGPASPQEIELIANLPAAECIDVTLLEYTPESLAFDVVAPSDGWLLVTDRWARSWNVEINEKPASLFGGNFIFRAVQVSEGRNRISFSYRPFAFPWLTLFSWSVLLAVCLGRLKTFPARRFQLRSLIIPDRRSA